MKRYWTVIARLLVAVLGIAFVVWSLTWHDRAVLPVGFDLPTGEIVLEEAHVQVVDRSASGLVVEGPDGEGTIQIPRSQIGAGADEIRYLPGIVTTITRANVAWLAVGLVLVGIMLPLQAWRWLILMRCRGLDPGFRRAMRLTMVGLFFNFCMPGTTGGDVIKAYYAAKGTSRRGAAIMSVVFDRLTGVISMVLLAGLMGLMLLEHPLVWRLTLGVWAGLLATVLISAGYFSGRVRRAVGLERLLARLPREHLLVRIDEAAVAYRQHGRTVLLAVVVSLPAHVTQAVGAALAGYALGLDLPLLMLLAVLPLVFFVGSAPITYQGVGVMEAVAIALLLAPPLATANQIVGMLVVLRLFLVMYALWGAVLMLRGNFHLFPAEEQAETEQEVEADVVTSAARPLP